jgi:putative thioredoxin
MAMLSGEMAQFAPAPIKDATTETFAADVLEASREVPVVVDFWAPWCGPCKQLTPIIEKVVREAAGRVRLVKVNVDENQQIAAQLGVQSIPAVFAFSNGRPVDGFMGALPESQVRHFIERLGGTSSPGVDEALEAATAALDEGDHAGAAQVYQQILGADPREVRAIGGLARCYIAAGDLEGAEEVLALTPDDKQGDSEIAGARAALELARGAGEALQALAPLEASVAANPNDHRARIDYAVALNAAGQREAALDQLIESIRRDREWEEGAARRQLLTLFEAWGLSDPLTVAGRRRLSSILFS